MSDRSPRWLQHAATVRTGSASWVVLAIAHASPVRLGILPRGHVADRLRTGFSIAARLAYSPGAPWSPGASQILSRFAEAANRNVQSRSLRVAMSNEGAAAPGPQVRRMNRMSHRYDIAPTLAFSLPQQAATAVVQQISSMAIKQVVSAATLNLACRTSDRWPADNQPGGPGCAASTV
jgi:hypothetical protein